MNETDFDVCDRTFIWVGGALQQLSDWGLIEWKNGIEPLTPRGIAMFDQMDASGFHPDQMVVLQILSHLMADKTEDQKRLILKLLLHFRYNRQSLVEAVEGGTLSVCRKGFWGRLLWRLGWR